MTDRDEMTVEELRDELRDRDLKVSGSKEELIARLEDADADEGQQAGGADDPDPDAGEVATLRDVVQRIRRELSDVLDLEVERVTGLERHEETWRAQADVVEVSRVPPSTDVLATYEVTTDDDGHVAGFERVRRFRRSEGSDR